MLLKTLAATAIFILAFTANAQVFIPFSNWSCNEFIQSQTTNLSSEFSQGTFNNTSVSGNSVTLNAGQTLGTYTSKVYDVFGGCSTMLSWSKFAWTTSMPFGKQLTTANEVVTDYASVSPGLMNNLGGLWYLNESASPARDATINSTNLTNSSGMTFGGSGKLLNAPTFNTGYLNNSSPSAAIKTTGNQLSVSLWAKRATNTSTGTLVQCGPTGGFVIAVGVNPYTGSTIKVTKYAVIDIAAGNFPSDTNWHHLAVVYGSSGITTYVDNVVVGTSTDTQNFSNCAGAFSIGGQEAQWTGQIDEVGIWTRSLTAQEVQQIYRRGANRLKFQVRSCTQNDCSDNPTWLGPNNTSATYFTELNNNTIPTTGLGAVLTKSPEVLFGSFPALTIPNNRYFQYKATFETDNTTFQPSFSSSTVNRGCVGGTLTFSSSTTWTLPAGCRRMVVTAHGGGGASARASAAGRKGTGGSGGRVIKTLTMPAGTVFNIGIGNGGACSQTAGSGGYSGGGGGSAGSTCGTGQTGGGSATGGVGGIGSGTSCAGGNGGYGGGGGGGSKTAGYFGGGGGGATVLSVGVIDYVVAGGGGASGSSNGGPAGNGGNACVGYSGSDGGPGSTGSSAGGGGGGACTCLGGVCDADPTTDGALGGDTAGTTCQASNNGSDGSLTITWQ